MSAYVIDNTTMQTIVFGLLEKSRFNSRNLADIAGLPTKPQELGNLLFTLNTHAVNHRYNETNSIPAYVHGGISRNDKQTYRALACLYYQCAEGTVLETPAGQALTHAYNALAHRIACQTTSA